MPTTCPTNKIDSNITGLRIAEEACLKRLPVLATDGKDPTWYGLEPNSYADFGGQTTTTARNFMNPSRQRRKGTITDLDASGGFNQDVTPGNLTRLMQGFMFADAHEKPTTAPLNAAAVAISSVDAASKTYTVASGGAAFLAGMLVMATGFAVSANNGLKVVASSTAGTVVVDAAADESAPPAAAKLQVVGFEFPDSDVDLALNGSLVQLVSAGTDLTTLGLTPGEWVFLGGDLAATAFGDSTGWARVGRITAALLEFDKIGWPVGAAADGTGKTIQLFLGTLIQNEKDPSKIKRRSYQLERTVGTDGDGTMSEYLTGTVANEFTLNVAQASKVTADFTFMCCDHEPRTGAEGIKGGARPAVPLEDAYNSTSDLMRSKLSSVNAATSYVTPLFAFATEFKISIKNGVSPNKAVGVLGAFDTSTANFEVSGTMTAYFADMQAVQAVRNNADITFDIVFVMDNRGTLFDLPLIGLGGGRLAVEPDRPITLPLETNAAESKFGTTLVYQEFPYLPNVAAA